MAILSRNYLVLDKWIELKEAGVTSFFCFYMKINSYIGDKQLSDDKKSIPR